jgi:hypothetical protein
MKTILRAVSLAALLFSANAFAVTGVANLNYTRATLYTDGSPMPASAIGGHPVSCTFRAASASTFTPCVGQTPLELRGDVTSGAVTFTFPNEGGRVCFTIRTRVGNFTSDPSSPEACRDLAPVPLIPREPGNVTVTITVTIATP